MKTPKSPEEVDVTPSTKKLKQARLPFKLLSDVSPVSESPSTRKRKLSAPAVCDLEPVTKVGKISKENGTLDDSVVISDDDSKDSQNSQQEGKAHNPLVKLVDNARKKKLQRTKSSRKKKSLKKLREDSESKNNENEKSVSMDVDSADDEINGDCNSKSLDISTHHLNAESLSDEHNCSKNSKIEIKDVIVLEDSNGLPDNVVSKDVEEKDSLLENTKSENLEIMNIKEEESDKDKSQHETTPVTTKRSTRNRNKSELKTDLNKSQSSVDDKSLDLNQTTPKQNTRSSISSNQDVSLNNSGTVTPKRQMQRNLESAKKKEEREKEKQEREKKKQQEKEERAKQRQEKEEQKKREREEKEEAKRKEKEEKEEQRRKEKEEKERQKELEKKLREEKEKQKRKEKEEKEEIRRKERETKEEEKRKKQEALELEKQEQEQKKKKAAEAFVNFFVPKQKSEKDQHTIGPVSKNSMLSSFTIKSDMRLAPTTRNYISDEQKQALDNVMQEQNTENDSLYIQNLKKGINKPLTSGATWPLDDKGNDDDVMIVEDDLPPIDDADEILSSEPTLREKLRPKLLSFHENRRPPYWGTWRKKSVLVKPRRPFHQDQTYLDYEVDSDEEWEEEQEGESIDGSAAGSDDDQEADEYEVDNEVFVPHGYLSDEEATIDEDDVLSLSPETQKARLKHLEDEFEFELKKPTEKLKPRMYGPLWETEEEQKPEKCVDALWSYFTKLSMIMNDPTPLLQPSIEPEETEKKKIKKKKNPPEGENSPSSSDKKKKAKQEPKETKKPKSESKKNIQEGKKSQPGINTFLTKLKSP